MKRKLAAGAAILILSTTAGAWSFVFIGRWLQFEEAPQPSDLIVVLAGNPERAIKAAELYKLGLAPEIWMSRPSRDPALTNLERIGLILPSEEDLCRRVLLKFKVPPAKVRVYADNVLSTAEEAVYLREALGDRPVRVLLVSNRTHLRRAKMILQDYLPKAQIRAVACDLEPAKAKWWTDKFLAGQVVDEVVRMVYYLIGGRFFSRPH